MSAAIAQRSPSPVPCPVSPQARRGELDVVLDLRHAGPHRVCVRFETRGDLSLPVVAALGGISAHAHVAASADFPERGWWEPQAGPGGGLQADRHCVLGIDWLGADGTLDAPIDTADQAAALVAVLDHLRIARLHALVGCSYGAMVGLAFAAAHPHRLQRLVAIAGAHRPHPFASAWRALQRNVVALGQLQCDETHGLSLARQLALLSYRTPEEFAERFDAPATLAAGSAHCAAEDWLSAHGARYAQRTPAVAFVRLSESIDLHRLAPPDIRVPTSLVAFAEDRLVPAADVRTLAAGIAAPVRLHVLRSHYGHDGFLKETDAVAACLHAALDAAAEGRA